MELLTFAHRGEAQSFLSYFNLKPLDANQSIYFNQEFYLLITGEGVYNTLAKLGPVLGKYKINHIRNFGIAGALNKTLKIGKIYNVRTSYGMENTKPLFHSYTAGEHSNIDCITSWQRVVDSIQAQTLNPFAQVVDRELWAIGKIAVENKISFSSHKLISDYAGETTDCFDIKARAREFSQKLLEEYLSLENKFPSKKEESELALPFHVSFTQKKIIEKLKLKISEDQFNKILSESKRADELIKNIENIVNPLKKNILNKINQLQTPFNQIGAKLLFDPKLENPTVKLQMEINSQTNIDKLQKTLADFDYNKINDFWNGKIDV